MILLMWFKNLSLFRLAEPLLWTAESLAAQLEPRAFQPCPSYLPRAAGWVPPLGRKSSDWVHAVAGCLLVCLRTEEKLLPAAVVNQVVAERAALLEEQRQVPVRRRERQELREQVVQELLPRALSRSRNSYAYLDRVEGWLVIDSASPRGVEEMTSALREALGELPITPLRVQWPVAAVMTAWLAAGTVGEDFSLGDSCELRENAEAGGVVRCRGQDLCGDEMRSHLEAGKQVTRLGLRWGERVALVLDEALVVRRLQFLDVLRESLREVEADSAEAVFDAEFALMSGELRRLLPRLLTLFGGMA
ncbi:MAG TPA: recombination-associated protein RdgC [Candidatus Competibacteraceae bacterium]|nr:MAG: recombination-associated protein RdgC [Candidatus Competibacteraceae bacterium]HQC71774.1 recombination-associated protein RdgC [Candidatus Competibacteraceae bacterium]